MDMFTVSTYSNTCTAEIDRQVRERRADKTCDATQTLNFF